MGFFRHPQQLWIRRANFQVHLWAGLILGLYVVIIGVTGSVLVFGAELEKFEFPNHWPQAKPNQSVADLAVVIESLRLSYPQTHIVSVFAPNSTEPVFQATLQSVRRITVACAPVTGQVLEEIPSKTSKLEWVYDLHENLLARRTGREVNGACAAALLLVAFTGLVNWWPGVRRWRKALVVDFRRRWKRINFDLHSAAGFWTFGLVVVWASSGIYFAWPDKVLAFVTCFSPVINSRPPEVTVDSNAEMVKLDFHSMIAEAHAIDPGTQWKGLIFPSGRRSPFEVLMSRSPGIGRDYEDTLYFNPYDGRFISIWRYGVNRSVGDWLIWLQIPLHFGTHWGIAVKCLWATFGLALPVLAVTGLFMYWNRFLSKRWRQLTQA